MAIGLIAVYVGFIAPAIVNPFIDDFLSFIITQAAVPLVQIMLFMFFFFMILFPISDTLRELETAQIEIFLAAPVKPSDVLLGEFLGKMPFYAIAIAILTGTFTAFLTPLGLDMAQIAIIIAVFVILFLSAFWIGVVVAAVLGTKLGKIARGKDLGRALSVIIVLPIIAVMYAIIGGGLPEALANPGTSQMVRTALSVLPSSWSAEIFVGFASNPGNIGAVGFQTLTLFGGLLIFFIAALWVGTKVANRAYSLDTFNFTSSIAKPDGFFYKTIRFVGGGKSFGTVLSSIFKDYSRRLENLSWIIYAVGLVVLIRVFISDPSSEPFDHLMFLSMMAIPFLAAFVVGTVSRGKNTLFIFKKSPSGIWKFVKARLFQGWLVAVPIATVLIAFFTILLSQIGLEYMLINVVLGALRALVLVAVVLGLAIINPIFAEESRERNMGVIINLMIVFFATMAFEIGLSRVGLSFEKMFLNIDTFTAGVFDHLLLTMVFALVGFFLLNIGIRKLDRIE
ncbi:hypothetical protein E2P64_02665 [Candidatus Bathyarchaeota archaeon]|nr:hypothetical protein E2P64_02665 [Candidatus Bathyarchaeota archaeon]